MVVVSHSVAVMPVVPQRTRAAVLMEGGCSPRHLVTTVWRPVPASADRPRRAAYDSGKHPGLQAKLFLL